LEGLREDGGWSGFNFGEGIRNKSVVGPEMFFPGGHQIQESSDMNGYDRVALGCGGRAHPANFPERRAAPAIPKRNSYVSISAPMFCLVIFQGVTRRFASAASGPDSPMSQIDV
jgi:hypothetical protein